MLYWLSLIVLCLGFLLIVIGCIEWDGKRNKLYGLLAENFESFVCTGVSTFIIAFIFFVILSIGMLINRLSKVADISRVEQAYKVLSYKMKNGFGRDENGILTEDMLDEIQAWNEDVSYKRDYETIFG